MDLSVAPGLYVLRYLGGLDARDAPTATVRVTETATADIDIISAPGTPVGGMAGPGSNLVIVARRGGKLEVVVAPLEGSNNVNANFSLDLLGASRPDVPASSQMPESHLPQTASRRPLSLTVGAHVARRGDVEADEEGWVGGPRKPSAIEGLLFRCAGADVGIAAQYMNMQDSGRWSAWVTPGSLVGTKQRASPITALRLKLVGSDAAGFELSAEALFLGSPISTQRGAELDIVTAGGMDVLVGLRIEIARRPADAVEIAERKPSRVRVFR